MQVRLLGSGDEKNWDEYVTGFGGSSIYHYAGWKTVIEKSFGHKTYYWLAENNEGMIRGVFPLVHLKSQIFGSFMVSLPFFNYGGVCAEGKSVCSELVRAAVEQALKDGAEHIEMRHQLPMDFHFPFKTTKVSMRLVLPFNGEELLKAFRPRLRNKIRGSMKEGMITSIGQLEELDSFYEVFSINMRDLGTPVYSKEFFRNILTVFPENTWICSVYKHKQPVASGLLIGFREILEIPWVSSIRKYNPLRPNILLYWTVLQYACEKGFKIFDFGRSTPGEGTYLFKEQWGAKPVPLYWYYWMRNSGSLPELNPKNPKYKPAIEVWKMLPVGLTRVLGPTISKNLP